MGVYLRQGGTVESLAFEFALEFAPSIYSA